MKRSGRRLFMRFASLCGLITGSISIQTFVSGCESDTTKTDDSGNGAATVELDISSYTALAGVGGAVKATVSGVNDGRPVVIFRKETAVFVVLSAICTHQGCEVELPGSGGGIDCICHGSQFSSSDGTVLKGPADTPLKKLTTTYNESKKMLTIMI